MIRISKTFINNSTSPVRDKNGSDSRFFITKEAFCISNIAENILAPHNRFVPIQEKLLIHTYIRRPDK